MHGIERSRKLKGPLDADNGIDRIIIRYSDGRVMNFVPDASREVFSEDDILELKKALSRAASTAEWSEVSYQSNIGG